MEKSVITKRPKVCITVKLCTLVLTTAMLLSFASCSKKDQTSVSSQDARNVSLSEAEIGSSVFFGSYEQNYAINGKEDIEWIVLAREDNRILVISRYALDCQPYNTSYTDVTWETCSLRKWLNSTFLNDAFSAEEINMILSVNVSADKNPEYDTAPGNDTEDMVFLLSIAEVNKYFSSDDERRCQVTEYGHVRDAYRDDDGYCWWWLRSPGDGTTEAAYVDADSSVRSAGHGVSYNYYAVRPALWINLGS